MSPCLCDSLSGFAAHYFFKTANPYYDDLNPDSSNVSGNLESACQVLLLKVQHADYT